MATPKTTSRKKYQEKLSPEETEKLLAASQPTGEPHDPDQAWYLTEHWQQGQREVDEHIRRGEIETFDSMDEFLSSLDNE